MTTETDSPDARAEYARLLEEARANVAAALEELRASA